MAVSKRKRTHKVSQGIHGATKHPLSVIERVLAGKGLLDSIEHVECKSPWRGVGDILPNGPFDKAQVEENKRLYPHLFSNGRRS